MEQGRKNKQKERKEKKEKGKEEKKALRKGKWDQEASVGIIVGVRVGLVIPPSEIISCIAFHF